IPTATFVPPSGSIATYQQVNALGTQVGLPGGMFTPAGPQVGTYSEPLANLLSFFAADASSQRSNINTTVLYSNYPYRFEYAQLTYSSASGGNWQYQGVSTVVSYGPSFPCPGYPSFVCPQSEPGLVVSTVQPTPLPSSVWLMASGVVVLLALQRNRQPFARLRRPVACG